MVPFDLAVVDERELIRRTQSFQAIIEVVTPGLLVPPGRYAPDQHVLHSKVLTDPSAFHNLICEDVGRDGLVREVVPPYLYDGSVWGFIE